MAEQDKTFQVLCAYCGQPFSIRLPLTCPEAEGTGEVAVTCQYCEEEVVIEVPQTYVETETMLRSIKRS